MSAHISGLQTGSSSSSMMWMRYGVGGGGERWQEVKGEEVSVTYVNERPGEQGIVVQRGLVRASAVCLLVLCVLLVVTIIVMAMHYNSSSDQLQRSYNQLVADRNQLNSNNHNLTLERDQLQTEVNHLKRETQVKSCPKGWKKFGCSCYFRSTDMRTWESSRDECLKTGADLVIINSKEEQEFIRGLIHWSGAYYSWIGLKRAGGNWTWVDGTPLTSQYWESGQPDNNKERNCAAYWHRLGWSNWLCSRIREYNWICEK